MGILERIAEASSEICGFAGATLRGVAFVGSKIAESYGAEIASVATVGAMALVGVGIGMAIQSYKEKREKRVYSRYARPLVPFDQLPPQVRMALKVA